MFQTHNIDIQQMMSLIINKKDVKGTDMEAQESKEHRQQQAKEHTPQQEKSVPNRQGKSPATETKEHTQPQRQSSARKVTEQTRGEIKRDAGAEERVPGGAGARQLPCGRCEKNMSVDSSVDVEQR